MKGDLWKWVAGFLASFILGGGISSWIHAAQLADIRAEQVGVRNELAVTSATQRSTIDLIKGDISDIKAMVARIDERTKKE